jgi:sigma-E factor negative regulatory protein RseC
MLYETGVVVRTTADAVWVKTLRKSTCGGCQARHGCGQGLLQRALASSTADIRARLARTDTPVGLQPGDEVEIGITEGAVVTASLLAYGLPIFMLIAGCAIGAWYTLSDPAQLFLGGLGLGVGLLISRLVLDYFKPSYFEPLVVGPAGTSPVTFDPS